jgi:2-keto-4-pentenoate hydratase/2-oxohepta-3-ene-1,7-dioic acid hydratase in catechol pathway
MLFPIPSLLAEISTVFTLQPGDVVLTGTPAGVGPLNSGDHLTLVLDGLLKLEARVA